MNCLIDATQENPNDRRVFSLRDSLTVQITCRRYLRGPTDFWTQSDQQRGPGRPDPLDRRAACARRLPGAHPIAGGLAWANSAGAVDGQWPDRQRSDADRQRSARGLDRGGLQSPNHSWFRGLASQGLGRAHPTSQEPRRRLIRQAANAPTTRSHPLRPACATTGSAGRLRF